MSIKKILLAACAAATLVSGAASAQPGWVPPGNDPAGYYSDTDHNGYYDRDGRYRRIRDRGGRYDRDYGRRWIAAMARRRRPITSRAAMKRAAAAAMPPPAPSSAPWRAG